MLARGSGNLEVAYNSPQTWDAVLLQSPLTWKIINSGKTRAASPLSLPLCCCKCSCCQVLRCSRKLLAENQWGFLEVEWIWLVCLFVCCQVGFQPHDSSSKSFCGLVNFCGRTKAGMGVHRWGWKAEEEGNILVSGLIYISFKWPWNYILLYTDKKQSRTWALLRCYNIRSEVQTKYPLPSLASPLPKDVQQHLLQWKIRISCTPCHLLQSSSCSYICIIYMHYLALPL